MKLTTFTDYSLRVLIFVAAQPEGRATIAEIARTYDISENHLTKVVHSLGKAGFLATVRGHGGGLTLARAASHINVAAVVRHTEGNATPAACFEADSPACAIAEICRLHDVLDEAVNAFYDVLGKYTVKDLVENRQPLNKILFQVESHDRQDAPVTEVPVKGSR